MTKPTKWFVHAANSVQPGHLHHCLHDESLVPLLPIERTVKTDQTGWMPRPIWVFAGCKGHFVGFVMWWLITISLADLSLCYSPVIKVSFNFPWFIAGIFKQMAWAAGGACVGGVVAGPPGALVGSIAGRYLHSWSKFYGKNLKVTCPWMPKKHHIWPCPEHNLFSFNQIFMRLADNLDGLKIS